MVKVNEAYQEALVGAEMLASVERLQAVGRLRSSAAWVLPPSAATSRASAGMECTHTAGLAQLEEERWDEMHAQRGKLCLQCLVQSRGVRTKLPGGKVRCALTCISATVHLGQLLLFCSLAQVEPVQLTLFANPPHIRVNPPYICVTRRRAAGIL